MDSSKKTTVKLSKKIDLKGVYKEEYFWRLILKENFQKSTRWIFRFFSYSCLGGLIQISLN